MLRALPEVYKNTNKERFGKPYFQTIAAYLA
jgi:hypothetical protein